jgi:flagellar biosynthesis chaperone FliJ
MDKDSFGNAVLSLVHLNMNAESPVDEILLVLDEVITQLEDDQKTNDRKNATDQAFCDDTLASLAAQVSAGDNTISQLTKSIADNSEIVSQATQDLDQAARDYDETVKSI